MVSCGCSRERLQESLNGGFRREKGNQSRSRPRGYSINPRWALHLSAHAPLFSFICAIGMEKLQARLQAASTEYQKLQSQLSAAVDSRQRLDAQRQENEMVKKVRSVRVRGRVKSPRIPLGICPTDSGKRSLQTHRTCSGKTGPTGGKN